MKPLAPNPRGQAVGWAEAFRDDWEECRSDPDYAPEYAWSLLAAWGEVCRFFDKLPEEVASIPALLQRDAGALLASLGQAPPPAEWLERARRLDRAWNYAVHEEPLRDLELGAINLFHQLDRHSLAVCMARRLTAECSETTGWLADWTRQVEQAEEFFADHVDAFLPVAFLARAVLANCRPDLDEADPELWETTLKHRRLEELGEEMEADLEPVRLTDRDRQAIQAKVAQARLKVLLPIIFVQWAGRRVQAYPRRLIPQRLLAAAAAGTELPSALVPLRWCSPDGAVEARLHLPLADVPAAGVEPVRLNLYLTASGDRAINLVGQTVHLAGIERKLDDLSRADFTVQELQDAGQDIFLGVAGEPWTPCPGPSATESNR